MKRKRRVTPGSYPSFLQNQNDIFLLTVSQTLYTRAAAFLNRRSLPRVPSFPSAAAVPLFRYALPAFSLVKASFSFLFSPLSLSGNDYLLAKIVVSFGARDGTVELNIFFASCVGSKYILKSFAYASAVTPELFCETLIRLREASQTKQKSRPSGLLFAWCERRDLNPYGGTTRPSNVRVCQFRHSRIFGF